MDIVYRITQQTASVRAACGRSAPSRQHCLQQATTGDGLQPETLTGAEINALLLRKCTRVSAGSAKGRVGELRSVRRFLYLQGLTPLRLGLAVPPVGGWRLAKVPPTISPEDVQRLLASCDRTTPIGRRDFAMMTVISRLGVRSIEIARLELEDLDSQLLGVGKVTIYRWLTDGFLTGEQLTAGAPWRIRIDQAVRDRIAPVGPEGGGRTRPGKPRVPARSG